MKKIVFFIFLTFLYVSNIMASENKMIIKLKDGNVEIQLFQDIAPKHVERIQTLVKNIKSKTPQNTFCFNQVYTN